MDDSDADETAALVHSLDPATVPALLIDILSHA
jgi:hypothetical protein